MNKMNVKLEEFHDDESKDLSNTTFLTNDSNESIDSTDATAPLISPQQSSSSTKIRVNNSTPLEPLGKAKNMTKMETDHKQIVPSVKFSSNVLTPKHDVKNMQNLNNDKFFDFQSENKQNKLEECFDANVPRSSIPTSIQISSDVVHQSTLNKKIPNSVSINDQTKDSENKYEDAEKRVNYFFKDNQKVDWKDTNDSFFHQAGQPIKIAMNVVVLNLADINTASMSYRMKLEIWVAWPLTKEEVISYYENPDEWKPYIHPEPTPWTITIEEIEKMKFLSGRETQVFLWRGKFVACECTLVTAIYLESMELVNFPFDCQHFHALIGTRCDCDVPFKVVDDEIFFTDLKITGGFNNFDGRAMAKMVLNDEGCTFNVRTHLLTLKDFKLENIECEIENHRKYIYISFLQPEYILLFNFIFFSFFRVYS